MLSVASLEAAKIVNIQRAKYTATSMSTLKIHAKDVQNGL